jgi:hypothetical protein
MAGPGPRPGRAAHVQAQGFIFPSPTLAQPEAKDGRTGRAMARDSDAGAARGGAGSLACLIESLNRGRQHELEKTARARGKRRRPASWGSLRAGGPGPAGAASGWGKGQPELGRE